MSQLQHESSVHTIPYSQARVYAKLSDLSNLDDYKSLLEQMPQDKIKVEDLSITTDAISCSVPPVGRLELRIVERTEPKCIKFDAVTSPIPLTLWIQIVPTADDACKMKLTLRTDLNIFMRGMLQKPLKEGIEKVAEALAQIPY